MAQTKDVETTKSPAELLAELLGASPQEFGAKPITGEEVEFHDGKKIGIPKGMTYRRAYEILERLEKEAETPTSFERTFKYRADDGAYAALQCIKARWGMALGKLTHTFFGVKPAETRNISIGVGQKMQVPWGRLEVPVLKGLELYLAEENDRDYGKIFKVYAMGPRKYKEEMDGFFDAIDEYLANHSIYRGRAIVGSDDPEFLDLRNFDPEKIVFSDDVTAILEGTLWAPIRYSETMRAEGVPLKRALLLEGPYGTGKTSVGQITAGVATENGWTFISAKPGRDKVDDVLRTARLYQPAVVFVEDIDVQTSTGESDAVSKLLDSFDGITAKGGELMVVMTTNHIERIHKGMLRPGRLDAVVEIAALDRNGCERLIKAIVDPAKLEGDIDYDAVYEAMEGFLPAFVRETINRAVTFAITRLEGSGDYTIATPDLVHAAHSLRPQLDALNNAGEGQTKPTLDFAISEAVKNSLAQMKVYDGSYEDWFAITEFDENGKEVERSTK